MNDDSRATLSRLLGVLGLSHIGAGAGAHIVTHFPDLAAPGVEYFWGVTGFLALLGAVFLRAYPSATGGEPA